MLRCFLSFLVVVVEDHVGCVSLSENPFYSTFSLFFYIFFAIKRTNPVHSFHFYDLFIPKARRLTRNIIITLPLPVRLSRIITEQEICHHPIIPTGYSIVVC